MGEVYLAHDPRLEREVAIKRVRAEGGSDPGRRARFLREARVVAGLGHPSIVQVYDLLSEEGTDNIVMEYVAGPTLHEVLRHDALPLDEGLSIAVSVAEGLSYAHRRGVLHRDLKAENVLLTPEGQAKIADFGIARRLPSEEAGDEGLTREGAILGTPRSMSPEQVCGDPLSVRSDLFSFGILLYEIFTGRSPFLAESRAETFRRVLQHRPPPLREVNPGLPPALSNLVEDLLEKDLVLRPRDANEVAGRLRELVTASSRGSGEADATLMPNGQGTSVAPALPLPVPVAASSSSRSRRPAAAALAAAVLILAGFAAFHLLAGPQTLQVAVTAPRFQAGPPGEKAAFLAFALRGALQSGLASLDGVFPKSAAEVDAVSGTPVEVARAVAADEVIETAFACQDGSCTLDVARLERDGAAAWNGRIEVPLGDPLTAARAVDVLLREAYAEREPRPGIPRLRVSPADYAEYLAIQRALSQGSGGDSAPLLERLAAVRRSSPDLLDAWLLEVTILVNRFAGSRDPKLLARASELLDQAQARAPGHPEIWYRRAYVKTLAGPPAEAEPALEAFERQAPGDVRVLDLRARLRERQGRPEEALEASREAADRQPSWVRLQELANLEWRQGEVGAARQTLDRLLAAFPGNQRGRQLLALLELTHGDPVRAARLYQELSAGSADPGLLVNLGVARMLIKDYDGAARAIERAVAAEGGGSYFFLLNLAETRRLQGRKAEADALFHKVLDLSAADPSTGDWQRLTVRAQAFAHLGDRRAAVAELQEALRLAPRSGQAAFEAALVYALVGDRTAAVVNAGRARDLGFEAPAWFRLPWFEPLLADPDFRRLAQSAQTL
jgi:eukaryotic-like serine/threonine-protein kinase